MDIYKIETVDDLWNHIAYVLAYAPDQFPYRDFIPKDQQMNLERAFEQLRQGIEIAFPNDFFPEKKLSLNKLLDKAYLLYQSGSEIEAGHVLNEFEDNIFKKTIDSPLQ